MYSVAVSNKYMPLLQVKILYPLDYLEARLTFGESNFNCKKWFYLIDVWYI